MRLDRSLMLLIVVVLVLSLPLASVFSVTVNDNKITPNDEFFVMQIGDTPIFDMDNYKLKVDGLVTHPLELEYDEIIAMPSISLDSTLKCVSGPSDRAAWKGVSLSHILDLAGANENAQDIIFWAADGYSSSLNMTEARADDVLLCYEMNGEPLPPNQGFPLKIVVPGHYGYKWVKWITEIEIIGYDYEGYWESRGWSDDARITPLGEWTIHAYLLSIGYMLCGLMVVSGYKIEGKSDAWDGLPDFVNWRFHKILSMFFKVVLIFTFIYWAYTTWIDRGDIFYSIHGLLSLIMMIVFGVVFATGYIKRRTLALHGQSALFAFFFYTLVIIIGVLMALGDLPFQAM